MYCSTHLINTSIYRNTSFTFYCTHLVLCLEIFLWAEVNVFQAVSTISRPRYVHIGLMHCPCHLPVISMYIDFSHFLKSLQHCIFTAVYTKYSSFFLPLKSGKSYFLFSVKAFQGLYSFSKEGHRPFLVPLFYAFEHHLHL